MPWAPQSQSSFTFCLLGRCQEPTMPRASLSQSSFAFCLLERGDGGSSCLQASILIYMYCMKGNQLLSPNHHTWKTLVFIASAKKWCAKTSQSLCGAMFGSMFASCIPTQLCLHWDRRYNEVGKLQTRRCNQNAFHYKNYKFIGHLSTIVGNTWWPLIFRAARNERKITIEPSVDTWWYM